MSAVFEESFQEARPQAMPRRLVHEMSFMEPAPLSLTRREADIVRLVAADLCNKQIADRLQISEWTVGTHMRRIFAKLGVRSRAAMVFRAMSLTEGRLLT